jgi:glycosyltransferase involved in cell wall biosynthesis
VRVLYLADAPYIHTRRVVQHFARLGHECEIVSFRRAEIEGVRVTYVEGFERLGKARYLLRARRVASLVSERRPDILHALHLTSYGFLGALSGYHPYVLSAWGTDILEAPRLTPFHNWLTRFSLAHADLITATGHNLAVATAQYAPQGRTVYEVPYGVDVSAFSPGAKDAEARVVIGTAARMSSEKGLRYLIEAFGILRDRYGDRITLRIAGDGPERQRLQRLAGRLNVEVDFAGWLEHERLPRFLQALDIFVLPSLYEGFGVAAVEASACGLPVVASKINGIPDVVADLETGILVPPREARALATAIGSLVDDPERRQWMGANGRRYVAEKYDWSKNMAGLARLYAIATGSAVGAQP